MISFYSGTPGSGKSLRVARDIVFKLTNRKQDVITNMDIDLAAVKNASMYKHFKHPPKFGTLVHLENDKITPEFLFAYALEHHKKGREGQTLIVIDEAQMIFSPTVMKLKKEEEKAYRVKWLDFFTQHRHLGYNVILISQFDKLIDAQVRCLFEYNVIHRKANNYKWGWIFSMFGINLFVSVTYWYGTHTKMNHQFFMYSKKFGKVYDSYSRWDTLKADKKYKKLIKNQMQES